MFFYDSATVIVAKQQQHQPYHAYSLIVVYQTSWDCVQVLFFLFLKGMYVEFSAWIHSPASSSIVYNSISWTVFKTAQRQQTNHIFVIRDWCEGGGTAAIIATITVPLILLWLVHEYVCECDFVLLHFFNNFCAFSIFP